MDYIPVETTVSGYDENRSWFGTNYNMNIYKVCSHGCIYRDRRSECYQPDDFDNVRAKENALAVIERDLKSRRRKGIVGVGAMSDPDNHFEKQLQLTGGALNIINRLGFGVWIYYQYLFFA